MGHEFEELSSKVLAAAIDVHKALGRRPCGRSLRPVKVVSESNRPARRAAPEFQRPNPDHQTSRFLIVFFAFSYFRAFVISLFSAVARGRD